MRVSMAVHAERDQIIEHVAAELASSLEMVNLKIFRAPTGLATPTIAFEDFSS
jgi:hypothetical protein